MAIRGYVFDAYGTLFDVHSVVEAGRALTTDPLALSALWRQKQLEYTWLRSLMGRYEDFWAITDAALRYSARRLGLTASDADVARLMDAYLHLACFPDVPQALARVAGRPRAILSNGTPRMLAAAVASSGLVGTLEHVISVDRVKVYKPAPAVYALGPAVLGLSVEDLLFVQRLGRRRRKGLRLSRRVVQSHGCARREARRARRLRRHEFIGSPHARLTRSESVTAHAMNAVATGV
jgi:2-haloacid dehalogenase